MNTHRNIQRIAQLTGVLFRLGILTPEEEKDIRERITQFGLHSHRKQG